MLAWTDSDELILEHRDLAHRFARRYRGLLERDDLYAVADEGLCIAARTWRPAASDFIRYLHSKVMQTVVNEIRREHGRPGSERIHTVAVEPEELEVASPRKDVETIFDLRLALDRLGETPRRMLCAHAAGYTLSEIADAYGVSESRVCQVTVRARRFLEEVA